MPTPHLTPDKLIATKHDNTLPPRWRAAHVAFVCFTPFPSAFEPYVEAVAEQRYFLHSPNSEVRLCQCNDIPFLVLSEVYGFAVGATTVEELIHHGINHIIGVGYVGAFNGAPVGHRFIATGTMSDLPLAAHYGQDAYTLCKPTASLYALVNACIEADAQTWGRYTVWSSNSLYREYPEMVDRMKQQGCDVVNMDTLSLYAVAPVCASEANRAVGCIYVGTVTDSRAEGAGDWDSDLMENVKGSIGQSHNELVHFLVETVLPAITRP